MLSMDRWMGRWVHACMLCENGFIHTSIAHAWNVNSIFEVLIAIRAGWKRVYTIAYNTTVTMHETIEKLCC